MPTDVQEVFTRLAQEWKQATRFTSSSTEIVSHPAYTEIIKLGKAALPFIFRELQNNGGHWFPALSLITGQDPVEPEDKGKIKRMTETWLKWGEEQGYVKPNGPSYVSFISRRSLTKEEIEYGLSLEPLAKQCLGKMCPPT